MFYTIPFCCEIADPYTFIFDEFIFDEVSTGGVFAAEWRGTNNASIKEHDMYRKVWVVVEAIEGDKIDDVMLTVYATKAA